MDCDQAFATLTRGPVTGNARGDADLFEHLARCPSCAKLAEALRPAPDVFHESIPAGDDTSLPAYAPREAAVAAMLRGGERPVQPIGSLHLYRAAAVPARRTWTAGRRVQQHAQPAVVEETPTVVERIIATAAVVGSATLMLALIAWGAAAAWAVLVS